MLLVEKKKPMSFFPFRRVGWVVGAGGGRTMCGGAAGRRAGEKGPSGGDGARAKVGARGC